MSNADTPLRPQIVPALAGIPETMLWTLYARAAETDKLGGRIHDPEAKRIRTALDYDFEGRFGTHNPQFALRAALIDGVLSRWLQRHPDGLVVSLGEGLETQFHRVDNGRVQWLTVDLPEGIRLRELFIRPGGRVRHLACSATDLAWMEQVGTPSALFVVAQGLFMYLPEDEVQRLLLAIAGRFPGTELVFDLVHREMSDSTLRGHRQSDAYVLPPMPWGLNRNEVVPALKRWKLNATAIRFLPYNLHHNPARPAFVEALLDKVVPRRQRLPSLMHIKV